MEMGDLGAEDEVYDSKGKLSLQDMLSPARGECRSDLGRGKKVAEATTTADEGKSGRSSCSSWKHDHSNEDIHSPIPVEKPSGGPVESPYDAHHMASDLLDKLRESQMRVSQLESVMEDREYAAKRAEREKEQDLEEKLAKEQGARIDAEEKLRSSEMEASRLQSSVSALESEKATWRADVFEKGMDITNKVILGYKETQEALNERVMTQEGTIEALRAEVEKWREQATASAMSVKELEQALDELEEEKRRDGVEYRKKLNDERRAREEALVELGRERTERERERGERERERGESASALASALAVVKSEKDRAEAAERRVKDLKGRLREEELRRGMAEEEKERARRETKESVARVVHAAREEALRRGLFKESVDEKVSGGDGMTPLMLSSERGDVEAIRLLLCAGADLGAIDARGRTALCHAAGKGGVATVKVLLDKGADARHKAAGGWTPLSVSAWTGDCDTVHALLAARAAVDERNDDGRTAAMCAAANGHSAALAALVEAGADVFAVNGDGDTCLHLAAERGRIETVKELVSRPACRPLCSVANNRGLTPASCARDSLRIQPETRVAVMRLLAPFAPISEDSSTSEGASTAAVAGAVAAVNGGVAAIDGGAAANASHVRSCTESLGGRDGGCPVNQISSLLTAPKAVPSILNVSNKKLLGCGVTSEERAGMAASLSASYAPQGKQETASSPSKRYSAAASPSRRASPLARGATSGSSIISPKGVKRNSPLCSLKASSVGGKSSGGSPTLRRCSESPVDLNASRRLW